MRIGFDLDGVIVDWIALRHAALFKLFDVQVPRTAHTRNAALATGLVSNDQYERMLEYVYTDKDAAELVIPLPGGLETIRELKNAHTCRIVTARSEDNARVTRAIVERLDLGLPVSHTNWKPKGTQCHGLDVFVDDDYRQLRLVADIVRNPLLFTHPYNTHEQLAPPYTRVANWADLHSTIIRLALSP